MMSNDIENKDLMRLNKYLAHIGICSRRKADDFISQQLIKVNGEIITELGYKVDVKNDKVEVLEAVIEQISNFKYILLNKPVGYVCSKSTEDGPTIFELLPEIKDLTYAGRLDKDSHGLVILSNDGNFVYNNSGAEFNKEKEYIVRVHKEITKNFLLYQSNGQIRLDGKYVRRAAVTQIDDFTYKIILTEGMNRQIRRMAENQGYYVKDLIRVRIGEYSLSDIKVGEYKYIEVKK